MPRLPRKKNINDFIIMMFPETQHAASLHINIPMITSSIVETQHATSPTHKYTSDHKSSIVETQHAASPTQKNINDFIIMMFPETWHATSLQMGMYNKKKSLRHPQWIAQNEYLNQ